MLLKQYSRERDITSGEFGVSEKQIGGRNLA
jgi:hypothetical protein